MRVMNNLKYEDFHKHVKCRWSECFAGMGLAGHGDCSARGAWDEVNCPEFETEEEFLEEWKRRK